MDAFQFGVFLPIANNGMIASTAYQYMPSFELNKAIALAAEHNDFDFIFSMTKWRGYGGTYEHWDHCREPFTLMSALAAVTSRVELVASVALLTMHPAVVARMVATIDDVSRGRMILNIVAGWNKLEFAQQGQWPGDQYFSERYDYATEYVHVLRQLWERGRVTFKGKYFELDDCVCLPKPSRRVPIIGAGQSEKGMRSAAQWADYNFVFGDVATAADLTGKATRYAAEAGRTVKTYVLNAVVAAATDEAAQAHARHIGDKVDREAVEIWCSLGVADPTGSSAHRHKVDAFMGVTPIIGSYETVAAYFAELAAQDVKGAVLFFPDFVPDVTNFGRHVIPLMRRHEAGLRAAGAPETALAG